MNIVIISTVLFFITVKSLAFLCCSKCLSHGIFVIWIVAEILLVQAICLVDIKNWHTNVSGALLCIGTSGTYLVWDTMRAHIRLVFLGLTLKEQHARLQSASLEFDHDPREDLKC